MGGERFPQDLYIMGVWQEVGGERFPQDLYIMGVWQEVGGGRFPQDLYIMGRCGRKWEVGGFPKTSI